MADVKWIKLDTGLFDNRKIKQIRTLPEGDSMIVIWVQLLCLAGNCNDGGRIYLTEEIPYTDQMLATAFNEPLPTIQMALHTFEMFGMIETIDDIIYIANWEKYQSIEGMEKIREQNRNRKRLQRERERVALLESHVTVTGQSRTVTQQNKNKKENKNKESSTNVLLKKRPTLEEVKDYVKSRGNLIDAQKFFDYYEAADWKDSKGQPVRNWKQKAITWERTTTPQTKGPDFSNPYKQEPKNEAQMSVEEAQEWYDNLIKELQDEKPHT